jgi:hypothetical protein
MHKKYGNDGFVALSVALDDAKDKEIRTEVDAFLAKKKANFTNLICDGDPLDWYKQLKIESVPCVYVFDKDNRFVLKLTAKDKEIDFKVVEAEVARLLKK